MGQCVNWRNLKWSPWNGHVKGDTCQTIAKPGCVLCWLHRHTLRLCAVGHAAWSNKCTITLGHKLEGTTSDRHSVHGSTFSRKTQHPNIELFTLTNNKMKRALGGLSISFYTYFIHDKNGRHFDCNYEAQNTQNIHPHFTVINQSTRFVFSAPNFHHRW